jgi:hypothetical protein
MPTKTQGQSKRTSTSGDNSTTRNTDRIPGIRNEQIIRSNPNMIKENSSASTKGKREISKV